MDSFARGGADIALGECNICTWVTLVGRGATVTLEDVVG
jgi:hypothetical protein